MLSSTYHMVLFTHQGECPKIYILTNQTIRIDSQSKPCANALDNKTRVKAGTVFNQINLHNIFT